MLTRWPNLACTAAAAALLAQEPGTAVTLLESGRAVLWQQTIGGSDKIDSLATTYPDVAARLHQLNAMLNAQNPTP